MEAKRRELNLIEAQMRLEYFIKGQDFAKLSTSEQEFLKGLITKIILLIDKLEAYNPSITSEFVEMGYKATLELYQKLRQQVISTLKEEISNLLPDLQDELIQSRGEQKKYNSSADTPYQKILQQTMDFCIGMINGIKYSDSAMEKLAPKILDLHQIAEELGATSIVFSQSFDPLRGAAEANDPIEKADGHCFGQYNYWGKQVSNNSDFHLKIFLNRSMYITQHLLSDTYLDYKPVYIWDGPIESIMSSLLEQDKNYIYDVDVNTDYRGGRHALGFRRIPNSFMIEFLDPNVGLFLFPNENSFKTWFEFLMLTYQLVGLDFTSFEIIKTYSQPNNSKSVLPKSTKEVAFNIDSDRVARVVNDFGKLWEKADSESKKDRIRQVFLRSLSMLLSHVNTIDEITKIDLVIRKNMTYIAKEKKGILTFFSSNPYEDAIKLIDNRSKQLQNNKENRPRKDDTQSVRK